MHRMSCPSRILVVLAVTALPLAATATAVEGETPHVMLAPDEMEWTPVGVLPPGATMTVVEGDPSAEGFFAARLKLPANYRIPPHYHPAPERLTVLEGTVLLGQGESFDEASLVGHEPGSYLSMPAGMRHFAATGDEEVVVQLASIGPWALVYVNPEDDPRLQAEPGDE